MLIGAKNLSVLGKARLGHIKSFEKENCCLGLYLLGAPKTSICLIIVAYGGS
jgi:hypothetical protein